MVNEFVAVEPCRYRWNISHALFSTSRAEAAQSVESTDSRLDFVIKQIQELDTHDSENKQEKLEKEAVSCSQTEGGGGLSSEHPWAEWSALMEHLVRNDYFKTFADEDDDDNGRSMLKDFNHVRNACLNFGRDRFDILRSLSKEDIRKIVQYGCPSIDRKVVNSGKRLRSYVNIEEGDVCSKCNVRGSCDRAYISAPKEESARTVDVMRILLTYGLDPIFDSAENKLHSKKMVKSSICKLLKEVVELSATPLDPNLPLPISKPTIKLALAPPKRQTARTDVEMKKGDWLCPRCDIINFARNMVCMQCDEKRSKNQLSSGEWECPDCSFINFSRNMKCLKCDCKRPKYDEMEIANELNPGDWKCPKCNFLNFRRNTTCRECDCKCPKNDSEDISYRLNAGDWKCPECRFMNFGRNRRCIKCECKYPNDNTDIARHLNSGDWKCPECGFMNFGRNRGCLKCECKRPNDDPEIARQLNPGDWKCPECRFPNFRRNMACLKCNCKRPKDIYSEIGRQRGNDCWADDISDLKEFKHVSRRSSGRDKSSSSGFNAKEFSDLDLDDFDDDRSEYNQKQAGSGRSSDRKDGGSSEANFNFFEFPVRGGKSEITGGRKSQLKENKNPSHWTSGVDRPLSSRVIPNDTSNLVLDDDGIGHNMKRADGVKPSGMASHRQCGSSTNPRGKEKTYKYDESDDEDGWFGSHHRKELGSSKRFSSTKPKSMMKSLENFGDLDNDDDVGYEMKRANSKQSLGRPYNRFASATSAKEKGTAYSCDNSDDEDDWFGGYKGKRLGLPETSVTSKQKSMKNTFGSFGDFNDSDDNNDLFESEDEQPQMSQMKKIGEARAFGSGNHITRRQLRSTSRNRKVGD